MCCVSCSRHFSTAKGDPSGDSGSSQSQSPPGSLSDLSEEELQAHLKDVGKKVNLAMSDPRTAALLVQNFDGETKKLIGVGWAVKELKSEFQKADISGDGQLSLEEFELWAQSIMAGAETEVKVFLSEKFCIYFYRCFFLIALESPSSREQLPMFPFEIRR